jgi:hypothetical protein
MSDDRREFLKLLATLGAAVAMPEMASAIEPPGQVKLERPIRPRILRREVTKGSAVEGSYLEVELVGANNAKQVFTSLSSKAGEVTTLHMTVASHADASDPTPTETSESTMVVHRKPIDANHSEVSGTLVMDGKVSKIGPVTAVRPSNLPSTEDMTDDELIANFLTPRLEGRKP